LIFGLLTMFFVTREFLHVWKMECEKRDLEGQKQPQQPLLLRSRKLFAITCLLLIAAGPVGHHSILIIKQLNEPHGEKPKGFPPMEFPWPSQQVIQRWPG
jgi:hypothetical protein